MSKLIMDDLMRKREDVVGQCKNGDAKIKECSRIVENNKCSAYAFPSKAWRFCNCLLSTNMKIKPENMKEKGRVGQQKQKKKKK